MALDLRTLSGSMDASIWVEVDLMRPSTEAVKALQSFFFASLPLSGAQSGGPDTVHTDKKPHLPLNASWWSTPSSTLNLTRYVSSRYMPLLLNVSFDN